MKRGMARIVAAEERADKQDWLASRRIAAERRRAEREAYLERADRACRRWLGASLAEVMARHGRPA